jgi:hypothetical protein
MSRIDPWAAPSSKNQTAAGKHGEDESSESFRAATKANREIPSQERQAGKEAGQGFT